MGTVDSTEKKEAMSTKSTAQSNLGEFLATGDDDADLADADADVGSRIATARETAGMDRTAFGAQLGVREETVEAWESGSQAPRSNKLAAIAGVLGVSLSWLMIGRGVAPRDQHDSALPPAPAWRGVNHLALVTDDMDTTTRFYAGVLGMPLVTTLMAGPMRHYFFQIAPGNTVAFFEIPDAEMFRKGAGGPAPYPTQLDHISFNVPDEAALHALQRRLEAAGSEVTEIVDHDTIQSIYFTDNNGVALEASYWAGDPTEGAPTYEGVHFTDPDPVPAVAELAAGLLESLPRTTLV